MHYIQHLAIATIFCAAAQHAGAQKVTQGPLEKEKVYRIQSKPNENLFITETTDHFLEVGEKDNARKQFWIFTPVEGQKDVYIVQNVASKRYLGSILNGKPGETRMATFERPVPFYVAPNAKAGGAWSLSSTDVPNYNDRDKKPFGLNLKGGTRMVVAFLAGYSNVNSYWWPVATTDTYEVRPFLTGKDHLYNLVDETGRWLQVNSDGAFSWTTPDAAEGETAFYVEGQSNTQGGYTLHRSGGEVLAQSKGWRVVEDEQSGFYGWENATQQRVNLGGETRFKFQANRSALMRRLQIYTYPCSATNRYRITRLTIGEQGDGKKAGIQYRDVINADNAASAHVVHSRETAALTQKAKVELKFSLSNNPPKDARAHLYFDWNNDGLFETQLPFELQRDNTMTFEVPETAVLGQTRFRLRLTSNDMSGADDEVLGVLFEGFLQVVKPTALQRVSVTSHSVGSYDLSGRKTDATASGLYIVNGQKVLQP